MRILKGYITTLLIFNLLPLSAFGKEASDALGGNKLFASGQYEAAAKWYVDYINSHSDDVKTVPQALINLGNALDKMSDIINTTAER